MLAYGTMRQLRRALREGRTSIEELTRMYLQRIETYDGSDCNRGGISSAQRKTLAEIVRFCETDAARMPYGISYLRDALETTSGQLGDPVYQETLALRERHCGCRC